MTVGRNAVVRTTLHFEPTGFSMKHLLISGFVAVALLAAFTTFHSYSISREHSAATVGSSKKTLAAAIANKTPIEEFEDMSFVFSAPPKH